MAIDEEVAKRSANRAEVGAVAIATSLSLDAVIRSLEIVLEILTLSASSEETLPKIRLELEKLKDQSKSLETQFDRLTGWTAEG